MIENNPIKTTTCSHVNIKEINAINQQPLELRANADKITTVKNKLGMNSLKQLFL